MRFKVPKSSTRPSARMRMGYSKYRRHIKTRRKRKKLSKFAKRTITAIVSVVGFLGVFTAVLLLVFLQSVSAALPNPGELKKRDFAETTKIYDRNGELLYAVYGDENREYVSLDKVPNYTKWAILAAEDIEFYDHKGVDIPSIIKGLYLKVKTGEWVRGASTISQQLVRNTILYDVLGEEAYERTIMRKVKEILITLELENELSKDEILELYINEVPLGGTVYGFQAAAKSYFNKDVSELTLAESALLAGLIQAPGYYSPLYGLYPEKADERKNYVLDQLEKYKDITGISQEDIDKARQEELHYSSAKIDIKAPHFTLWVKQLLIEEYGVEIVERGGLKVTTTLDYNMQQVAEDLIKKALDEGLYGSGSYRDRYNVNNASMIVIDPKTGEILTMVGSYDYWETEDPRIDGNVNVVLTPRQMGSSVKPYTYLTAFSQGYSPALITPDIPMNFGSAYKPRNWDGKYKGLMFMRDALLQSRNIPALYTVQLVGVDNFINTAEKLGITTLTDRSRYGVSITLGAAEMKLLEHASAYTVFANMGIKRDTTPFLKIEDKDGNVLYEHDPYKDAKRVFSEQEIYLLNWILCNESNTYRPLSQYYQVGGQKLCGKTGTTDGPRDLVALLYYPKLVVGVWAGNNNNEITCGLRRGDTCLGNQAWSTTVPLPIAHAFMTKVVGYYGNEWYTRPGGIATGKVCNDTGLLANDDCASTSMVFMAGHLPPKDKNHEIKYICKENGLVATNAEDAKKLDLVDEVLVIDIQLENDAHQKDLENWLKGHKDAIAKLVGKDVDEIKFKFELPEEGECPLGLGEDNAPLVTVENPTDTVYVKKQETIDITFSVKSLDEINKITISVDGTEVEQIDNSATQYTYTVPNDIGIGEHALIISVTDSGGRTGSATINFVVDKDITISIIEPINSASVTFPQVLSAQVGGADASLVESVKFVVSQENATVIEEFDATYDDTQGQWRATWNDSQPAGNYVIDVIATAGETTYTDKVGVVVE